MLTIDHYCSAVLVPCVMTSSHTAMNGVKRRLSVSGSTGRLLKNQISTRQTAITTPAQAAINIQIYDPAFQSQPQNSFMK